MVQSPNSMSQDVTEIQHEQYTLPDETAERLTENTNLNQAVFNEVMDKLKKRISAKDTPNNVVFGHNQNL